MPQPTPHQLFFVYTLVVLVIVGLWPAVLSTASNDFVIEHNDTHLSVSLEDVVLVAHSSSSPFLFVGTGSSISRSLYGNYKISDYVDRRVALPSFSVEDLSSSSSSSGPESEGKRERITFSDGCSTTVSLDFVSDADTGQRYVEFAGVVAGVNRLWLRLYAEEDEHVYGGGEQFTHFDMRGKTFPLWVQEQGVGRNQSSLITLLSNNNDGGGGDYYTTYWAQPTFLSSRKYYAHFTTTHYSEFDFRSDHFHEIYIWGDTPGRLHFFTGKSYVDLVERFTGFQGRQPLIPEWLYNGVVLGLQGGTERMLSYYNLAKENGIKISGLWIQDWSGRIKTSFGRRIFWNWEWNPKHYPDLIRVIKELKSEGVQILVYANLNLNREGNLFKEAEDLGFLILNKDGGTYILDYGEFFCGIVDITNPKAAQWFKDRILKKNIMELGISGWMADFGEYLPTDAVFHNGQSGTDLHNEWPTLWAKINREAVEEAGKLGEILYWMRAGFSGSQNYGVMTWAGDQFVDFSLSDGLGSVIPAALSLGVSGFGLSHFDIGGYTSLFNYTRTEELIYRYGEIASFTSMMRTHEGNRPDDNLQFYSNERTLFQLAYNTKVFHALNDYRRVVVKENADRGIPVQRPLFMHYENDAASYSVQYQYLFGRDLMVAPVYEAGRETWDVYLPEDEWVFLWDDDVTSRGGETVTVPSPIGCIPVFFRRDSPWASSFREIKNIRHHKLGLDGDNAYCTKGDNSCQDIGENAP